MDLHGILSELHAERKRIDDAIDAMERLVQGRRGNRWGSPQNSVRLVEPKGPHLVPKRKRAEGSSSASDGEIPGNTASG
jgi:hypothetical protein